MAGPNPYGNLPLVDEDPTNTLVTRGNNPGDVRQPDYWDYADYVIDQANASGLYIAFLPTLERWVIKGGRADEPMSWHPRGGVYSRLQPPRAPHRTGNEAMARQKMKRHLVQPLARARRPPLEL